MNLCAPLATPTSYVSLDICYHRLDRLWMEKQERAYLSWLNHLLAPYTPDLLRLRLEDEQAEALASRRLVAQVRQATQPN